MLLKQIAQSLEGTHELKILDHRYFLSEAPAEGFPTWNPPTLRKRKIRVFSGSLILAMLDAMKHFPLYYRTALSRIPNKLLKNANHVPSLFSEYKSAFDEVVTGRRMPYEKQLIEWADIILINGEGNIVNGTDAWGRYKEGGRYVLFMAYLAKAFGKKTAIINHTVDPDNQDAISILKQVYPQIDYLSVREPYSIEKLEQLGVECTPHYIPDALFSYMPCKQWTPSPELKKIIDFSQPYICLGDSSGIQSTASTAKWNAYSTFSELIDKLRAVCPQVVLVDGFAGTHAGINAISKYRKVPTINLFNCPYTDLIEVLGRSKCFVSGRWHASIMAALNGTPFVLWGSDSHKTKALTRLFNYPFNFYSVHTLPLHLDELCNDVKHAYDNEKALRAANKTRTHELQDLALTNTEFLQQWLRD